MRVEWGLISLSVMGSMVLGMIVFGQQQMWTKLSSHNVELSTDLAQLEKTLQDTAFVRGLLQKQLELQRSTVEELGAEVTDKLPSEERQRKTDLDACQADKVKWQNFMPRLLSSLKAEIHHPEFENL